MEAISKNHLKEISRLNQKKFRQTEELVIAEGLRTIRHLTSCNVRILELYLADPSLKGSFRADVEYLLQPEQFARITNTRNPQNIAALVQQKNLPVKETGFLLYLDQINEPGNLGTIVRTAEAAGASGIILSPGSCSIFNPKTIRASMGSVFTFPIEIRDIDWLKKSNSRRIATTVNGAVNLFEYSKPSEDIILIIGSEAHGIRPEILDVCHDAVMIPLMNNIESLNAAIATGIALYYFLA